jgi:PIN domain nuclease of toxin-antitoxin system
MLIWLYEGPASRLSVRVHRHIESEQLGLSPISQLELGFLHEVGRLRPSPRTLIDELTIRIELAVADISAAALYAAALPLTWARDPFDRLLAAHSLASQLALVTADESMRRNLPLAWWAD